MSVKCQKNKKPQPLAGDDGWVSRRLAELRLGGLLVRACVVRRWSEGGRTKTFLVQSEFGCDNFSTPRSIQKTLFLLLSWFEIFGRHVATGHSSEHVKAPVDLQAETDIFSLLWGE